VADRPGLAREPPDLRGAQGVAAVAPGRREGCPLHGGAADAPGWPSGRGARQAAQVDRPGARGGEADGSGETAVHRRPAERLVGERLHLRADVAGLRVRGLRGSQYLSIRYTDRLIEAGIEPSVGSVGDSYDNALAEIVIGLFKTEVTHRRSWRSREEVEAY